MKGYMVTLFVLIFYQAVLNEAANPFNYKTPEGCTCTCPVGVTPQAAWNNLAWKNPAWNNQAWNNPAWKNPAWNNQAWNNQAWKNPVWNNQAWKNPAWNNQAWNRNDPRWGWNNNATAWRGGWAGNQWDSRAAWPYNQWNYPGYAGVNDLRAAVDNARSTEDSKNKNQ